MTGKRQAFDAQRTTGNWPTGCLVWACRLVSTGFNHDEALAIFENQKETIEKSWDTVCDEAELTEIDRKLLRGRQFLNPFIFEGLQEN